MMNPSPLSWAVRSWNDRYSGWSGKDCSASGVSALGRGGREKQRASVSHVVVGHHVRDGGGVRDNFSGGSLEWRDWREHFGITALEGQSCWLPKVSGLLQGVVVLGLP